MTLLNSLKALPFLALGLGIITLGIVRFPAQWAKWDALQAYTQDIDYPELRKQEAITIESRVRDALEYNPADADLQAMLANIELDHADAAATAAESSAAQARAADAARAVLRTHPADPYAWYQLALALDKPDQMVPEALAAFRMSLLTGRGEGQLVLTRLTYCALHWDQLPAKDQADCRDQGSLTQARRSIFVEWSRFRARLPADMQIVLTEKIGPPDPILLPNGDLVPAGTAFSAGSGAPAGGNAPTGPVPGFLPNGGIAPTTVPLQNGGGSPLR